MNNSPTLAPETKHIVNKDSYPTNWTPIGRYYIDAITFSYARAVLTIPIAIAAIVAIVPEKDIIPAFVFGIMALILYIVGTYYLQIEAPLMAIAISENYLELYNVEKKNKNNFIFLEKLDLKSLIAIRDKRDKKLFPRIEFTFKIENEIYNKRHIFIPRDIFKSYQKFFNDDIIRKIENPIPILIVKNQ